MSRNDTFFKRLTDLFRSGPAIRRRVKGVDPANFYDAKVTQGNYGYRAPAPFGFGRENSPFSVLGSYGIMDRNARYSEFAEMEFCLHGDTKIAVPNGYKTIKELSEEYGLEKEFIVYSYDHTKKQIVPAVGRQARLTRYDDAYKVKFNSGKEIIGTSNHRLMKRDGSYCEIKDLKPGDAMMPFYRKDLFSKEKDDTGNGYRFIYTMDYKNSHSNNGWVSEHRLIASWVANKKLSENEVVHHKNYIKHDNRPENLQIMTKAEHAAFHNNDYKWNKEKNSEWIEKFKIEHSKRMKENNPAERKDITFEKILYWCDNNTYNLYKVAEFFNTSHNVIKRKLKHKGFKDFISFAKTYNPEWKSESWDNKGSKNPRFNHNLTFQSVCDTFQKGITHKELAKKLNVSKPTILARLKDGGYNSWSHFIETHSNHKVVSVEYYGKIPLYDLTVDEYKNFATDTVISHNTPELASALDIYADETVASGEDGNSLHIYSDNVNIKRHLDELFYDVLNVEFNLRSWTRNLPVKWDTQIPLLSGENISIKELSERIKSGKEEWVYSVQSKTNKIVPGKVIWCDKSYTADKIVRVWLDDDTYVETSPEHTFILRNGEEKRADELTCNDSLMPFYTKTSSKSENALDGYEKIYNPSTNHYKYTHRIVSENIFDIKNENIDKVVTHHVDFNKLNNHPNNLKRMGSYEHIILHSNFAKKLLHTKEVTQKRLEALHTFLKSDKRRKKMSDKMKGVYPAPFEEYNNSLEHEKHNKIRSAAMDKFWKDKDKKNKSKKLMTLVFDENCINYIENVIIKQKSFIGAKKLGKLLKEDKTFLSLFCEANKHSKRNLIKSINYGTIKAILSRQYNLEYYEFISQILPSVKNDKYYKIACSETKTNKTLNHKVVKIEIIQENTDVYCMNVVGPNGEDDRHNFAICSYKKDKTFSRNGVFVSNCKFGDFFLFVEVLPEVGIINAQPIAVNEIEREEGYDENDPHAVRFKWLTRGNVYLENWQVAHLRILGNDLFLPYGSSVLESARRIWRSLCVSADENVWTQNGYKPIKEIKSGDIVYCYDYTNNKLKTTKVVGCLPMGKQKIVKVKTRHRTIQITPNHGLLVKNKDEQFEYKKAEDLICSNGQGGYKSSLSDRLILPYIENGIQDFNVELDCTNYMVKLISPHKYNTYGIMSKIENLNCFYSAKNILSFLKSEKRIPYEDFIKVKKEFNISNKNIKYFYKNSKYESSFQNLQFKVTKDFCRFFGFMLGDGWINKERNAVGFALGVYEEQNKKYINLLETLFSKKSYLSKPGKDHGGQVNVSSKEAVSILEKLEFKTGVSNKRIPKWAYKLHPEYKAEIIKGYHDADGSDNDGRLTSINKDLLNDIRILAQQCGMETGQIILDRPEREYFCEKFNRKLHCKTSYRLYVNFNKINKETQYEKVISVEESEEDETYDLQVEDQVHNFVCEGIISHNTMLEDAMLVYRVVRSPERRVFYIDVANVAPNDIPSYMEAAKATLKSSSIIEKSTGRQDFRYNPLGIMEDFYIPVRGTQSGTKIDTLQAGQHVTATEDVQYMQSKLFAAIKVPKPYLNYDENLSSKSSLSQMDIRFSRTITNLQKIVISELNKLAMIHLYAKGFDGEDLVNFELKLSNPSTVAVQQKLELWATKADVAGALKDTGLVDEKWIQKHVFELTGDDVAIINKGLYEDRVKEAQLDSVVFDTELDDNATTDTFSPTNYEMPGEDVPKSLPPEHSNDASHNTGISIPNNKKDNPYKINYQKGSTPVKATPFLTKNKRNRARRVGAVGGRDNTTNPDFSSMLSANNRFFKDVYDMRSLRNPTSEGVDKSNIIKLEPILPNDVKSMLKRLKDHFNKNHNVSSTKRKLLSEENEINHNNEDDFILEIVSEETEQKKNKNNSSLKEVMKEIDNSFENNDEIDIDLDIE